MYAGAPADTRACGGTFAVSFPETTFEVTGVRVETALPGWEEIDNEPYYKEVLAQYPLPTSPA